MSWTWLTVFFATFVVMEFVSWALHKYVMHGPLWVLHRDHHVPPLDRRYQKNDFFAAFFALPSFFSILIDRLYDLPRLGAFGYGIMAYGAAYFVVHEVLIHRRLKLSRFQSGFYVEAVNAAHKVHHSVRVKEGCENFGMLLVPISYFRAARARRRARR